MSGLRCRRVCSLLRLQASDKKPTEQLTPPTWISHLPVPSLHTENQFTLSCDYNETLLSKGQPWPSSSGPQLIPDWVSSSDRGEGEATLPNTAAFPQAGAPQTILKSSLSGQLKFPGVKVLTHQCCTALPVGNYCHYLFLAR